MILSQKSPQGVPEDHVQLISCLSLLVKNNHREDNFRRKQIMIVISNIIWDEPVSIFFMFSYTRNYEQSDRLDYNCISHQLSNDKTFSLMSKMDLILSIGHVHIQI